MTTNNTEEAVSQLQARVDGLESELALRATREEMEDIRTDMKKLRAAVLARTGMDPMPNPEPATKKAPKLSPGELRAVRAANAKRAREAKGSKKRRATRK